MRFDVASHAHLLILGAVGHVMLWVALVNRAHGLGIKRRWVDLMTLRACCVCDRCCSPPCRSLLAVSLAGIDAHASRGNRCLDLCRLCAAHCMRRLGPISVGTLSSASLQRGAMLSRNHTSRIDVAAEHVPSR